MGWIECEIVTLAGRRVGVKLLYNSVHRKFNQLEIRWGRENQHRAEEGPQDPRLSSCREDVEMKTMSQRGWAPGPRLSSLGEWKRNAVMAIRVGVNMLQFCSVSNSLSHTTLSIKWEVYFSKEVSSLVLIELNMFLHAYIYIYIYSFMAIQHKYLKVPEKSVYFIF